MPSNPLPSGLADELNFLLTNRIPRVAATRLMGRVCRIENAAFTRVALWLWQRFGGLDLADCPRREFRSIHDCFTREIRPGARPLDPDPGAVLSPCDGIVMACGTLQGLEALQAKGLSYPISGLLGSAGLAEACADGVYVTIRLTSGMYHRFHAPADGVVRRVRHIAGDAWNVNPPAVKRVPGLYCRNERAVIEFEPDRWAPSAPLLLVPVAAVGVAGLRLRCLPHRFGLDYRGAQSFDCNARARRGEELGWFEQGSTIIVIAPRDRALAASVTAGQRLRMGQRLMVTPGP